MIRLHQILNLLNLWNVFYLDSWELLLLDFNAYNPNKKFIDEWCWYQSIDIKKIKVIC